jgi:hypothetical protein
MSRPGLSPAQNVPVLSAGLKRVGRESDHQASSSADLKNDGALPPRPARIHGLVLNYLAQ